MAIGFISEQELKRRKLPERSDKFDSIVVEYLRRYSGTMEDLSQKLGCSPTSLWRYRRQPEAFMKAPFEVVCAMMRFMNVSNHDLRYICGLPTGLSDDEN